jgi:hypothetical protein
MSIDTRHAKNKKISGFLKIAFRFSILAAFFTYVINGYQILPYFITSYWINYVPLYNVALTARYGLMGLWWIFLYRKGIQMRLQDHSNKILVVLLILIIINICCLFGTIPYYFIFEPGLLTPIILASSTIEIGIWGIFIYYAKILRRSSGLIMVVSTSVVLLIKILYIVFRLTDTSLFFSVSLIGREFKITLLTLELFCMILFAIGVYIARKQLNEPTIDEYDR